MKWWFKPQGEGGKKMTGFHSQSMKSNTSLSKQYKSMPDATVTYVIFTDSETKINASHRHFNLHFILVIRIFLPYPLPTVSRLLKKKKIKKIRKGSEQSLPGEQLSLVFMYVYRKKTVTWVHSMVSFDCSIQWGFFHLISSKERPRLQLYSEELLFSTR